MFGGGGILARQRNVEIEKNEMEAEKGRFSDLIRMTGM